MLQVREAALADVESIVELTAAGWRAAYGGIVSPQHLEKLPIAAWRHDVRNGLSAPERQSFTKMAELDGTLAGYCYVAAPGRGEPDDSGTAEVVALYVDPERWRQGVGRALMESAAEEARGGGFEELALWSFERNERALAFYEAQGFRLDGSRRPHEASGAPTIGLRMPLSQPTLREWSK